MSETSFIWMNRLPNFIRIRRKVTQYPVRKRLLRLAMQCDLSGLRNREPRTGRRAAANNEYSRRDRAAIFLDRAMKTAAKCIRGLVVVLLCGAQMAWAAGQCQGIYDLARSAQRGFSDITGPLLFKDDKGASFQATYQMPRGDCQIFRGPGLAPTYECVWDFSEQSVPVMRHSAQVFAEQVARCTRTELVRRTDVSHADQLPAEWRTVTRKFGAPVSFAVSAIDSVTERGDRIRQISIAVEKK